MSVHDTRRGLETERRTEESDRGAAFLRKLATAPRGPGLDISFSRLLLHSPLWFAAGDPLLRGVRQPFPRGWAGGSGCGSGSRRV